MAELLPHERAASDRVVAVLGKGVVPADTPVLTADDLGVLRGDGVFETMHVRGGRPWLLDEHLARMARSAARLDLTLPAAGTLADLARQACARWPVDREGALRVICTRGREGGGPVTAFATLTAVSPAAVRARRAGATAATAAVGFAADARAAAPWLLGGVKTLSYAMNMACQRWAAAHGVDEMLWLSADGYVLEAPTASLVWLAGDILCVVPERTGILPGITARWLLDHAGQLGYRTAERLVTPTELTAVDGVWLLSTVRGAVPVRTLDGVAMPLATAQTVRIRTLLGYKSG